MVVLVMFDGCEMEWQIDSCTLQSCIWNRLFIKEPPETLLHHSLNNSLFTHVCVCCVPVRACCARVLCCVPVRAFRVVCVCLRHLWLSSYCYLHRVNI